jgi:hypothetical protein
VQLKAVSLLRSQLPNLDRSTYLLLQATAQLNKKYYKNPSCISAMASVIAKSPETAVSLDEDSIDAVTE